MLVHKTESAYSRTRGHAQLQNPWQSWRLNLFIATSMTNGQSDGCTQVRSGEIMKTILISFNCDLKRVKQVGFQWRAYTPQCRSI